MLTHRAKITCVGGYTISFESNFLFLVWTVITVTIIIVKDINNKTDINTAPVHTLTIFKIVRTVTKTKHLLNLCLLKFLVLLDPCSVF